jgi:pimeloyl-ACP methyl ester carboxylesterase
LNISRGQTVAGLFGAGAAALLYGFSREMLDASHEFSQLVIDPVFFGAGVPRGDGHPVVVIPGFLASDYYLQTMRGWLQRMGYAPYTTGIRRNTGQMAALVEQVMAVSDRAMHEHDGSKPTLIGHSLGGLIARRVAQLRPEAVRQVIALGSPISRERAPLRTPVLFTAIYSRADRIVRYPRALAVDGSRSIEVASSHIGLVFNSQVYRALGELLNQRHASAAQAA